MSDDVLLPLAQPGEQLRGDDLQAAIHALRQMATGMDALMTDDSSVAELREIARLQSRLRDEAGAWINARIDLLAGEARVSAEQISGAVGYAREVIDSVADTRKKLAQLGAVLGFVGAVSSGNGKAIWQAARELKSALA
jgi:small-conductance mechanosensitive channel